MYNQNMQQPSPIVNTFGSVEKFKQQYDALSANLSQNGMTPEAAVNQLLNSGKMSQEQFIYLSQMANQILGRN